MKNLLLLFALLLGTVGAWAQAITELGSQVTDLSTITEEKSDQYFVVQVVKFKASDASEQDGIYLYTIDTKDRIRAGRLDFNSEDNYQYLFNIQQTDNDHFLLYVNQKGIPSFAKTATGAFSIDQGHTPNDYAILPVDGQNGVFMLRGYADDRAHLMVDNNEVKVTNGATNAMYIKIFNVASPLKEYNAVLTDEAGNKFQFAFEGVNEVSPILAGVTGYSLTEEKWTENSYTATITFPFPVSKEGGVTNATMITSFKTGYTNNGIEYQYGYKWYASDDAVKFKRLSDATVPTLNDYSWAIYPQMENSQFTFAIKNVSTGKYISTDADYLQDKGSDGDGTVILSATPKYYFINGNDGYIYYIGNTNKINHYLSAATNGSEDEKNLGVWAKTHNGATTEFIPQSFAVSVGESGYASLYTPIAGTISGDNEVKTYAITADGIQDGYATLTEMTGVAANQGVIIKANEGSYTFTAGEVSSDWTDNLLTGTSINDYVEGAAYVLANEENGVGLYKAALNKDADGAVGDTHFLNNAGKAYLPASAVTGEARFLVFNFGGNETAIKGVEGADNDANAVIYDLFGRRVLKAQKGLYIVNGAIVIK